MSLVKKCPYCSEDIAYEAIKCKHCGEFLDSKSLQNRADSQSPPPQQPQQVIVKHSSDGCGCFATIGFLVVVGFVLLLFGL